MEKYGEVELTMILALVNYFWMSVSVCIFHYFSICYVSLNEINPCLNSSLLFFWLYVHGSQWIISKDSGALQLSCSSG